MLLYNHTFFPFLLLKCYFFTFPSCNIYMPNKSCYISCLWEKKSQKQAQVVRDSTILNNRIQVQIIFCKITAILVYFPPLEVFPSANIWTCTCFCKCNQATKYIAVCCGDDTFASSTWIVKTCMRTIQLSVLFGYLQSY